jgi:peptide-methionine (S)-S-oxide reductase
MRLSRRPSHRAAATPAAAMPPADGASTSLARWLLGPLLVLVLLLAPAAAGLAATEEAVLAGGCFWCLEHDLEDLPGVLDVESGYSGGRKANPSYGEVSAGGTGHQESVRVRFDNTKIRYEALLRAYWRQIDPFDGGGQFCDRGDSYRPVIFTTSANQAVEARNSLVAAARELGRPAAAIKVAVRPLAKFWPAETYHQNYARRNGLRYRYYRWACRRDQRLDAVWGVRARRGDRWQATQAPAPAAPSSGAVGAGSTATGPAGSPAAAPKVSPAPLPAAKPAGPLPAPAPQPPAAAGSQPSGGARTAAPAAAA